MAAKVVRPIADLKLKAGVGSLVLGLKFNTLKVVGNSSVVIYHLDLRYSIISSFIFY